MRTWLAIAGVWTASVATASEPADDTVVVSMATPAVVLPVRTEDPALERGHHLMASGDVLAAIPELRDAVSEEVGSLRALRTLGQALLLAGDLEEAESVLHRAASVDPEHVDTVEMLAIVRFQRGNYEGAHSMFQRVLRVDADRDSSIIGVARCHVRSNEPGQALVHTAHAMELGVPGAAELHADALSASGQGRAARRLRRELRRARQVTNR